MGQIIRPTPISYGDIDLTWMVGRHVSAVSFHEPLPWVFALGSGSTISVECLWRIIEHGRIVLCSHDHGHRFGLPAPVDGVVRARELLAGPIKNVRLREATADLIIDFEGDRSLEIIPTSMGYESWQMSSPSGRSFVAEGRGRICTWTESSETPSALPQASGLPTSPEPSDVSEYLEPLVAFLEGLPAMELPAGRKSIGAGVSGDGRWWVKFSIDTTDPLAWRVVQELGHVLNYLSIEDRLPTVFMPVSPPSRLNGGAECLSWVIENHHPSFTPAECVRWLEKRLPEPVTDHDAWWIDDDDES